jgi:hypothetical protein
MPMRREQVAAALKYLQDKADLRGRAERAVSLDPQEQDLADVAVETGASLIPGVGQALAARDVERARRANDPAGMAMASMGAIPGGRLAKLLKGFDPTMSRVSEYDPRFDLRVKEQERLKALTPNVESRGTVNPKEVSITEFEGRPFIISQSDRTAAGGVLKGINDVTLNQPVVLRGGQDFMFENPGMVWASGKSPVSRLQTMAAIAKKETGQDPLYLPYRMTPSGGDFAAMTGEAMLNYADAAMTPAVKREVNRKIKDIIPDWAGLGSEKGIEQYQKSSQVKRDAVRHMLDKDYRQAGGLNIGEARLSVTDPRQYTGADTGLQNVGVMYAGQPTITQSGHPSYPFGVPGEGIGRLKEDIRAFELLPDLAAARRMADPRNPNDQDYRSLMVPRSGIVTSDILKRMGF